MHVLICDDDAASRFALRQLLTRQAGCTVVECGDGSEALAQIDRHQPDLVFLDVEMQPVNGVVLLKSLRSSAAHAALRVVMLSYERRNQVVGELVRLGIDGYILKPARPDKVLEAVALVREQMAKAPTAGAEQ